jgi:hypothetical protein
MIAMLLARFFHAENAMKTACRIFYRLRRRKAGAGASGHGSSKWL